LLVQQKRKGGEGLEGRHRGKKGWRCLKKKDQERKRLKQLLNLNGEGWEDWKGESRVRGKRPYSVTSQGFKNWF